MEITGRQVEPRCSAERMWGVSGTGIPMLNRDAIYD